ncbi:MAG: ferredoxin:glutaredoxin reductase [Deltaproteobacteria bacterium]|nr:MAG: ferredoxin:glutaredoxin reductase [Deltaproteobacteria bacterium]
MNEEAEKLYERLRREAEEGGYLLNPDRQFVLELMEGLVANQKRYGYLACPCRLADGERGADLDIICPCDYRDPDLAEFGTCYCGLYVSEEVASGKKPLESIPDRRPPPEERKAQAGGDEKRPSISGSLPVWRCRVCGYLCAREQPPLKCPICKADRDRFERFG